MRSCRPLHHLSGLLEASTSSRESRPQAPAVIVRSLALAAATALTVAFTGCGIAPQQLASTGSSSSVAATSSALPGIAIHGHAHGGAFPIEGATVSLMETQTNGYGGQAKLLEQVTSDNTGYFLFDNNWTCDSGQYAYVVISSGHTVATSKTNNNNVLEVGVVGACSQFLANTLEKNNANVFLSEPSTIAAAYTLGNFITIDDHKVTSNGTTTDYGLMAEISAPANNNSATPGCTGTGNGMNCTAAGLAHGFVNAYNLVDSVRYDGSFPSGLVRTSIPGNPQSVVPQALINTLGNILQACVDSNGVNPKGGTNSASSNDGTQCGQLFEYATPPSGSTPTNTLQVALNMAQYPGNNVDQLFNLQPQQMFFSPSLSTDKFSDNGGLITFSVSIFYEGTGMAGDTGFGTPVHLALDGNDNVFVLYSGTNGNGSFSAVDGLSAGGQGLFLGPQIAGAVNPNEIALDNVGTYTGPRGRQTWVPGANVWFTDDSASGQVYRIPLTYDANNNPNGLGAAVSYSIPNGYPAGLAVDQSNNAWIARDHADGNQSMYAFAGGQYWMSTLWNNPTLATGTRRISIDAKQDIFGVTSDSSGAEMYVYPFGVEGTSSALSVSQSMGANAGFGIVMSNSDEGYMPLNNELQTANATQNGSGATFTFGSDGTYTTTSGASNSFGKPGDVALDGSGNLLWTDNESTGKLYQMVPSGNSVANGKGTLTAVLPCFPLNNQCYNTPSDLRGLTIDSSGAVWYLLNYSPSILIQTFGLGENSWPLTSYAAAGLPVR